MLLVDLLVLQHVINKSRTPRNKQTLWTTPMFDANTLRWISLPPSPLHRLWQWIKQGAARKKAPAWRWGVRTKADWSPFHGVKEHPGSMAHGRIQAALGPLLVLFW